MSSRRPRRPERSTTGGSRPATEPGSRGGDRSRTKRLSLPPGLWAFAPLLLIAIAVWVHHPALRTFFAQDDVTFLARARGLAATPWSLARPLSEGLIWRGLEALFGLNPLPYHLFTFGLHLANTALVYAIGARLLGHRAAALGAAALFGASGIAFTPLTWTSCLVELTVTTCTLGSFALWLRGREPERPVLLALATVLGLAALLSKESAILFPAVLVVACFRLGAPGAKPRVLFPQAIATGTWAAAFLATLSRVHYIGSDTYAMSGAPQFIGANLATYLRWVVTPQDPIRDRFAAMDPGAWATGLVVAAAIAALLWSQRREPAHPEEVGAIWFLAFLAPVVPLAHHTYLYYLYLPFAGLCWLAAGAALRLTRSLPPTAAWARAPLALGLAVACSGLVWVEHGAARERTRAMNGSFPADKTVREAMLLRNAVTDLRKAGLVAGDRVAFVNPAPVRHAAMSDTSGAGSASVHSYIPLEGAMRGGETIRLFFPGVEYLGFARDLPRAWEEAEVFLYQDEGTLRHLGKGSAALAELGTFGLKLREWTRAEAMFLRTRTRGDTLADATFGLIITRDFLGDLAGSRRYAAEFLRRWPGDSRAEVVRGSTGP